MSQLKDSDVKGLISGLIAQAAPNTRVIPMLEMNFKAKDWIAVVRSLVNDGVADGCLVTRRKRLSKKVGPNHFEYQWLYWILYFKSFKAKTSTTQGSEDDVNDWIEAVAGKFESSDDLGNTTSTTPSIDDHDQLQVQAIDMIDSTIHTVLAELPVNLTKQPS